jgi:hypothetical protein
MLQDATPLTGGEFADPTLAAVKLKPHPGSALASHLMGQISLFNLATAITALQIGVPGRLTIEIPSRVGGRIEIDWRPASRTTHE